MRPEEPKSYDLDHLSKESWQLELLASGIILLLLFSTRDFAHDLTQWGMRFINDIEFVPLFILIIGITVTPVVSQVFFVIHIIVRGLWIGGVGLRSVSGDVSLSQLKFHRRYHRYLAKYDHSFDRYIEQLERLASVLFSFNFLLLFYILTACLIFCWIFVFFLLYFSVHHLFVIPLLLMILASILMFLDFITLNRLKRGRFGYVFYPVFVVMNTLGLSFLYRSLHYNFIDHPYTRKLLLGVYALFVVATIIANQDILGTPWLNEPELESGNVYLKGFYEDRADKEHNHLVQLSSFYNSDYLEVKVPLIHNEKTKRVLLSYCPELEASSSSMFQFHETVDSAGVEIVSVNFGSHYTAPISSDSMLSCYRQLVQLELDERVLTNHIMFFENSHIDAIRCVIPLDAVAYGPHELKVYSLDTASKETWGATTIPFIRVAR